MTFIDWFAGIGGFRRGMELAGHKCVGFCEKDKYAVASYTSMHLITEEQRAYLETLSKRERQKEILKDEYKNGEWYADDVRLVEPRDIPTADCWCFGAPCQNFSIAGNLDGLRGSESVLVGEIFRLLKGIENRPEWLLYENVKGMLSSNKGWDYFAIISAMDELGFDVEWQIINSKDYVPQNRERVYTVGHFRRFGRREVFPLPRTDGENHVLQIGQRDSDRYHPQNLRTYDPEGIAPTLDSMSGGGRHPHIPVGGGNAHRQEPEREGKTDSQHDNRTGTQGSRRDEPDGNGSCVPAQLVNNEIKVQETWNAVTARYYKGITNHQTENAVLKMD